MKCAKQETYKMSNSLHQVWLGIGGNLGDRKSNIEKAIKGLEKLGQIKQTSEIIETKAWGITDRPDYLNLALELHTSLLPHQLLEACQQIEKVLGREKSIKWDSRIIDIDILYYNDWFFTTPSLIVPHPFIQERDFVLKPLSQIAPSLLHPTLKETQLRLLENLTE